MAESVNNHVAIGCRLPNGYVLEIGLQTTVLIDTPAGGKALVEKVAQTEKYERFVLRGTNEPIRQMMREAQVLMPSRLRPAPYINRNVPRAFWEQWKKEHPLNGALKRGDIFEVRSGDANEKAQMLDVMSKPGPLEPLEQGKFIVGDHTVEKAQFDKD